MTPDTEEKDEVVVHDLNDLADDELAGVVNLAFAIIADRNEMHIVQLVAQCLQFHTEQAVEAGEISFEGGVASLGGGIVGVKADQMAKVIGLDGQPIEPTI